jgi:hypothetical protein
MAAPILYVTYSVQDAKGNLSHPKIHFPRNANIPTVVDFAVSTATLINNLITGRIIDASICLTVDLSGATIRAAPDPGSDVEEGAMFSFGTVVDSATSIRLPTFDEANLVAGTKLVNQTDTEVSAFVNRMKDGLTVILENVQPSDSRGESINSLISGIESFQASR